MVMVAAKVLDVLMFDGDMREEFKILWWLLEHLVGRVEAVHQQCPASRAFMPQAMEHLNPAI